MDNSLKCNRIFEALRDHLGWQAYYLSEKDQEYEMIWNYLGCDFGNRTKPGIYCLRCITTQKNVLIAVYNMNCDQIRIFKDGIILATSSFCNTNSIDIDLENFLQYAIWRWYQPEE